MNSITFKIVHGADITRITVDPSLEFSGFLARVKESVPNLSDRPLFWVDEEGDRINLVSSEDYQEALNFLEQHTKFSALRLYVEEETKTHSELKEGMEEETEAEIKQPESEMGGPAVHASVICNECASQVVGHRFKCTVCWDCDLCNDCHGKGVHPEEHVMLVIKTPIAPFPFHRAGYPCHRHRETTVNGRPCDRPKEIREARKLERVELRAQKKAERIAKKEARKEAKQVRKSNGEESKKSSESSSAESEELDWESDAPPYEDHHHHGHHHHGHHHHHHHHAHHHRHAKGEGKGKGCGKGMWGEEDHGKGWGKGKGMMWGKGKGCWGKGKGRWAFGQEVYAPQIEALQQMGFNDPKKNLRLLWKCDGDVDAVVSVLTRMRV